MVDELKFRYSRKNFGKKNLISMSQSIDSSKAEEFKRLQIEGKHLAAEGKLVDSLQKFELAKKICPTPKILQRIEKLKECLKDLDSTHVNLTVSHISSASSSIGIGKVPSNLKSSDQSAFVAPKVLNDIINVQKSNTPCLSSKSNNLSPVSQSKFKELKKIAKELAYDGRYDEALKHFKKALAICDCPNVKRYVQEIQSVISNDYEDARKIEGQSSAEDKHEPSAKFVQESVQENTSLPHNLESNEFDREKKLENVKVLYEEARELAADGKLPDSLKILKKAQSIHETQKVQKKIDKLQQLISSDMNDCGSNDMMKITDDFSVFHDIYNKLYPYQREGVAWMWKLFQMGKGGVLADDMGLGKTFQVIAFISGMIDADLMKHALIIMPVSLLTTWEKEFKKWCPGISVHDFHRGTKKERERNLLRVQRRGHILVTSYGMVVNNVNSFIEMDGREFVWDYVILDEGHKIKNPTKTTKAVYEIPSKNRLVLTGTPIQNNLKELWSLYDFVQQGTLLGSLKTFKMQYEIPITRSREKDATAGEKRLGTEIAENLKSLIKPYFIRRTKEEIWGNKKDEDMDELENQLEKMTISQLKGKKNDLILWTYMSESQIEIYKSFLHSDAVKSILVSKRSPLVELTTLKKICDHPRLLSQRACLQLGLNGELRNEDLLRELDDESTMASSIDNVSDESLLIESGKLKLVIKLLENLRNTGHRTLVFSLSRKILDMIHRILINRHWKVMRLDGTISKTEERERRIQKFQNDSSYPVFLLTTQVGGVGITLTAADRVIIYDPSWNPATDAQAVDRVYRIGQDKDVIVYRLITCGSVEEKIYRRQIFKDSITRQATGVADPHRYFSKQELRELFSFENSHYSATQVQLCEMHSSQRRTDEGLEIHIAYLQTLNIFGISDHDLMFSRNTQDHSEDNDQAAVSENFIKKQVAAAHELIKMEASVVAEGIRLAGTYNRPYQEVLKLPKKTVKDTYKPPVLPEVIDLTEDAQNTMFSPEELRLSLKAKSPSDGSRKSHSPEKISQGISLNEKCFSFSTQKNKENSFSVDEKKTQSVTSPKNTNAFSMKEMTYGFESDKMIKSKGFNNLNTSCEEHLQNSLEPSGTLHDKVVKTPINHKKINSSIAAIQDFSMELEEEQRKDQSIGAEDVHSSSFKEQNVSTELNSLKLIPDLQEKFKSNLTQLMSNDLKDLSFDPEVSGRYVKAPRRSCARQSTLLISDSDMSRTESDSNPSMHLVNESEDTASEPCDFSNNSSISFVPDSASNTPQTVNLLKCHGSAQSVSETPPRLFHFDSESMKINTSFKSDTSSFLRKHEGSVRGITPLKVDRSLTQHDSSFVQAMATSLILSPLTSPKKIENKSTQPISTSSLVQVSSDSQSEELDSDDSDMPIQFIKKKKPLRICSDSEDSENEQEIVVDLHEETNKSNSEGEQSSDHSNSNAENLVDDEHSNQSNEEEGHGDSEHSNISDEEKSPSDSEYSIASGLEGHSDCEYSIASGLEGHSDCEYSNVSGKENLNDSEHSYQSSEENGHSDFEIVSSSDSDESGSVFSEVEIGDSNFD